MIWFEAKQNTKDMVKVELAKLSAQWANKSLTKLAIIQMQTQLKGLISLVQHLECQDERLFEVFPVVEVRGSDVFLYLNCHSTGIREAKPVIEFWGQFGLYVRYSPV